MRGLGKVDKMLKEKVNVVCVESQKGSQLENGHVSSYIVGILN